MIAASVPILPFLVNIGILLGTSEDRYATSWGVATPSLGSPGVEVLSTFELGLRF